MKSIVVRSVMLQAEVFQVLDIEIQLVPGLPTIQFLGLPSPGLKESALRIRSALRASGFELPKGRQILVDIRPREEKKPGRGVDLAVAIGFLHLTKQIDLRNFLDLKSAMFYGDLTLNGEILAPRDWERVRVLSKGDLVTGIGPIGGEFRSGRSGEGVWSCGKLRGFQSELKSLEPRDERAHESEDSGEDSLKLEASQAEIAALAAVGGHSLLLAGPQGTGKSTLARIIHRLRPRPNSIERHEIETWSGDSRRPLVEPHHTASELAMVGGRQPPRPGAITRAHHGTLLMDEVLLFRPDVQEALREPLETGDVHLARGPEARKFPADFQLLGTTNLCECGRYTPTSEEDCVCSSRVRARFESRLRGPFVDRFQMLAFTNGWRPSGGTKSLGEIREITERARSFQVLSGREFGNRRWRPEMSARESSLFDRLMTEGSERRRLAIRRVARTWADLETSDEIREVDIERARRWTLDNFVLLHWPTNMSKGSPEPRGPS